MFYPQFYKNKSEEVIQREIQKEGFNPIPITDSPGFVYQRHQHPETKLLVFLHGSMDVTTGENTYHCVRGDKLIIPGNTLHEAVVGNKGCTFFWSEKIL